MEVLLATVGLALMFGLSGAGSAMGLVIGGNAVIGAIRKRPEIFGLGLVLSGLPATQGLYGFVGFIIYNAAVTPHMTMFQGAVVFGAGLGLGIVNMISAIKMGQVCAAGISNMGMGHNSFGNTLVLAVFPEFYAILGLVASILMSNLLKLA